MTNIGLTELLVIGGICLLCLLPVAVAAIVAIVLVVTQRKQ